MVAKTFQTMTQLCDPYEVGGKMYVRVKNEKTGTIRQVRWYTEKEYAKLYPSTTPVDTSPFAGKQKEILGFQKGYITIFKGWSEGADYWFQQSIARYARYWGWYIVSTEEIPATLPAGVEAVQLPWELVGNPSGDLKTEDQVRAAVDTILFDKGSSVFMGAVGERLDLEVTIVSVTKTETNYGTATTHYMEDALGNRYSWHTTAKSWEIGDKYHIRGTVKAHEMVKNVQTTVLTRCALVNK